MAGDFSALAPKVAFSLSVAPWHNKFVDLLREAINKLSKMIDPDLLEQAHFLPEDGIDISEAGNQGGRGSWQHYGTMQHDLPEKSRRPLPPIHRLTSRSQEKS